MDIVTSFKSNFLNKAIAGSALCLFSYGNMSAQKKYEETDNIKRDYKGVYYNNPDDIVTPEDRALQRELYKAGYIREFFIYPNEKIKEPTKTQAYLQELLDITQESPIGKNLVNFAKREHVPIHSDTLQYRMYGYYHKAGHIGHQLYKLNSKRLPPEKKRKQKSQHVLTMIEELTHAKQDKRYDAVFEDIDQKKRLYPESRIFKNYCVEAAAKTIKVMTLHELKENGHETLWSDALEMISETSCIYGALTYYDKKISQCTNNDEKTQIASDIFEKILLGDNLRNLYFPYSYDDLYAPSSQFHIVTQKDLNDLGKIPGTRQNFIKNLDLLDPKYHIYTKDQFKIIDTQQEIIRDQFSDFMPNTFARKNITDYIFDSKNTDYQQIFSNLSIDFERKKLDRIIKPPLSTKPTLK